MFQYFIYDWNSFIADIGGYLGLLLGQSIFGMCQLLAEWVAAMMRFKWGSLMRCH